MAHSINDDSPVPPPTAPTVKSEGTTSPIPAVPAVQGAPAAGRHPLVWMALGSLATLAVGGAALFALKTEKQQPDVAAKRSDGPEARPPEPAPAPSPSSQAGSPSAEVVQRPAEAVVPPKVEVTPAQPARPDEPMKVEPAEAPEAKKQRLSLEAEWRAFARFKGATTDTVDKNLHITTLAVLGPQVSDADFAEVRNLPHLKRLVMRGGKLGLGEADLMSRELNGQATTGLNGDKVTDAAFEHIATLEKLEELDAIELPITDAACKHIGKLKSIRYLRLSKSRVSDDGLMLLADLPNLEAIELAGTTVSGEGLAALPTKRLRGLDLRGTRLKTQDLNVIGRFTELRVLHLPPVRRPRELPADSVYAESFGEGYGPAFELEPADGYKLLPAGSVDYVAGLKHLAGLVHLESVEMTRAFRAAAPNRPGRRVQFGEQPAWDDSPLLELDKYRKAYVTDGKLDVAKGHAGYLGAMLRAPDGSLAWKRDGHPVGPSVSIASPDLYQFLMRPSGALIGHIRDWDNVTSLDLSSFMVVDDDLKFLAKHARLERLDLSGSPVTAKGLAHLKGLTKLKYLNLRGAAVGDGDLASLRELKGLRDVVLSQTNVTAAGAETFRRGAIRVVFDAKQKRPWWCDLDWRAELANLSVPHVAAPAPKGADTGTPEKAAPKVDFKLLPDYYPLAAGTAWEYEMGKQTLVTKVTESATEAASRTATVSIHLDGKLVSSEVVRIDDKGIYRLKVNKTSFEPPVMIFKFGVEPEATWALRAKLDSGMADFAFTFKGDEEIKVPAGTYKVAKVSGAVVESGNKMDSLTYYAKGVGVVRTDLTIDGRTVVTVLRKFTPGGDDPK